MSNMTPGEAFAALRRAGLIHDDPNLVRLFDTSEREFVANARAAKPGWFFNASTATPAQLATKVKQLDADACQRTDAEPRPLASDAQVRDYLREAAAPPPMNFIPPVGFDAMNASPEEFTKVVASYTDAAYRAGRPRA